MDPIHSSLLPPTPPLPTALMPPISFFFPPLGDGGDANKLVLMKYLTSLTSRMELIFLGAQIL